MWVYVRREGSKIQMHRLGVQWWHGLAFWWRTARAIYSLGLAWHNLRDGTVWQVAQFTIEDWRDQQARIWGIPREQVEEVVPVEDFYA